MTKKQVNDFSTEKTTVLNMVDIASVALVRARQSTARDEAGAGVYDLLEEVSILLYKVSQLVERNE